jgi:hypothetical protein
MFVPHFAYTQVQCLFQFPFIKNKLSFYIQLHFPLLNYVGHSAVLHKGPSQ